jgi:hypothetical protein
MAEITTVKVVGKKGELTINVSDLAAWRKQGYRLASEPETMSGDADTAIEHAAPAGNKVKVRSKTQR